MVATPTTIERQKHPSIVATGLKVALGEPAGGAQRKSQRPA